MKTTFDYFRYLMIAVAIVFAFAACSDDDNEGGGNKGAEIMLITPENGTITCLGTNVEPQNIVFTASNDWTATTEQGWLQLSKRTGGAGESQSIYLTIEDNDSFEKSRIGTVTIKDKVSGKSADVVVTQGGKDATIVLSSPSDGELIIDNENNIITAQVNVLCNYDFDVKTDKDWLGYQEGAKNDDGSVTYTFKADPEKLYADGGYSAKVAKVSFNYQTETRALPENKVYDIKFNFTPTLRFEVGGEVVDAEDMPIAYRESDEVGKYYAALTVVSNYQWKVGETPASAKVTFAEGTEIPPYNPETGEGGEAEDNEEEATARVNGAHFFETKTTMRLDYTGDAEGIEAGEAEKMTFINAATGDVEKEASFRFPGLGTDYLELVRDHWNAGNEYLYMFEAAGEEELYPGVYDNPAPITITIKAAQPDKVAIYAIKLNGKGLYPTRDYIDEYGDPISNNATEGWNSWLFIEDETANARSSVQEIRKTVVMRARGNEYGDPRFTESTERYFVLLVVNSDTYPTYEDLFYNEEDVEERHVDGDLKDELRDKIAFMGQKGLVTVTMDDFQTVDWESKETFTVKAEGETIVLKYSGLDLSDTDQWNSGLYVGGDINDTEWANGWDYLPTNSPLFKDVEKLFDVSTEGEIRITVAPNTTGKARSETCAIANGVTDRFFATFKIEQAAN